MSSYSVPILHPLDTCNRQKAKADTLKHKIELINKSILSSFAISKIHFYYWISSVLDLLVDKIRKKLDNITLDQVTVTQTYINTVLRSEN